MSNANSFLDGFMRGYVFMDQREDTKRRREREDTQFSQGQEDRNRRISREDVVFGREDTLFEEGREDRTRNIAREQKQDERADQEFEFKVEDRGIAAETLAYDRERHKVQDADTSAYRRAATAGLRLGNQEKSQGLSDKARLREVTKQLYRLKSTERLPEKVNVVAGAFQANPQAATQAASILSDAFNPETPFPEDAAAVRQAANVLMPDILKRAVGKPARGGGTVADVQFKGFLRRDGEVIVELDVTKDDGTRYVAPLTSGGTSDDADDPLVTDEGTLMREVIGRAKLIDSFANGADPAAMGAEIESLMGSEQMRGVMNRKTELEAEFMALSGKRWGEPASDAVRPRVVGRALVDDSGNVIYKDEEKVRSISAPQAEAIAKGVIRRYGLERSDLPVIEAFAIQNGREPSQEEIQRITGSVGDGASMPRGYVPPDRSARLPNLPGWDD